MIVVELRRSVMHPVIITGDPRQNTWLNSVRETIESFYFGGRSTWHVTKDDQLATLDILQKREGLLHGVTRISSYILFFPFFVPFLVTALRTWQGLNNIKITQITHHLNDTTNIASKFENNVWKQTKTIYTDAAQTTVQRTEIGVFDREWTLFDGSISENDTTKHVFLKDQYSETYQRKTYYFGPHIARIHSSLEIDLVLSHINWRNTFANLEGTVTDTELNSVDNAEEILADLRKRKIGFIHGTLNYNYNPDSIVRATKHPLRHLATFFFILCSALPDDSI